MNGFPILTLMALLALPLAATAQTATLTEAPESPAPEAAEAEPLGVIDRWRADPSTIFDGTEITLDDLRFIARPVVVFADSPNDPLFSEQMALLMADLSGLAIRDVIVITDTSPAAQSDPRRTLRPRGFALVVIGKDGRVAQRKPSPWSVREIGRAIDRLPLRQQEIRDGTALGQ